MTEHTSTCQCQQHCSCCISRLSLGPRLKRILLYLVKHPDWETTDRLEGLHFRFVPGNDRSRVTVQEIGRRMLEDVG